MQLGMVTALPDVLRRYLQAYNAMDLDALLATVSDDVTFEHLSNTSEPTRTVGKAELATLARQSVQVFSSRCQTVVDAVVEPQRVALRVDFEATVAIDLPNGWKAGQRLELRGASFFTLRDALICKIVDLS